MQIRFADHRRAALRAQIARARKIARVNKYVVVVALLWLVTSIALLFLSTPAHARSDHSTASHHIRTQPQTSSPDSVIVL